MGAEVPDLKEAFTRIGADATAAVKSAVAVDSGKMQSTVKQSRRKNSVYIYAGSKAAYYAPFVEFGTKYQPAQFTMHTVARSEGPKALQTLEDEMQKLIHRLGLDS